MTQHDIINIITITISLVALIILIYFYPKIKSSTKTYNDANEIINLIIKELRERLTSQDLKISDLIIKSEIIENKLPFDLLSIELRDGIQNLSKITGQELTEEILDNIFSKFCIGK